MRCERFDPRADPALLQVSHELMLAGRLLDDPLGPPVSLARFTRWFAGSGPHTEREGWLLPSGQGGGWDGVCLLEMPLRENTHRVKASVFVAPGRRRAGLGSALLRQATHRAAEQGRTLVTARARLGTPGDAFAAAVGGRPGPAKVRRVLDLGGGAVGRLDQLRERVTAAAAGYRLVSWFGPVPAARLGQVVRVTAAMDDAPRSPLHRRPVVDAGSIRAEERWLAALGLRWYSVAARCGRTGELAGLTRAVLDPQTPGWAFQQITVVSPAHRGHRLGTLVKLAILDLLAVAEPGLAHVLTENAEGNEPMTAINDALGFRVLDRWCIWSLDVPAGRQPAV